jgi:hypothetical protein
MSTITLTNEFHNSAVTLRPTGNRLSPGQVKRAKRELCGIDGCTCSDSAGTRGRVAGIEEIEFNADGSAVLIPAPQD